MMLAARASEPEDNSRLLEMARAWEALGKESIEGGPKSYNLSFWRGRREAEAARKIGLSRRTFF